MSPIDFIFTGIIAYFSFGLDKIPKEIPFFTLNDLSSLFASMGSFWVQGFSISSRFFPFALFFIVLQIIMVAEMGLVGWRFFKYMINILRGAGG